MEWSAIILTLQLAGVTTVALVIVGTPLAWWLARAQGRLKTLLETLTALPLVLPPTVLGFYLLVLLSPQSPLGAFWLELTGDTLTFNFSGLAGCVRKFRTRATRSCRLLESRTLGYVC